MGFLTRGSKGEDTDDEEAQNEELYQKLFPKIGRDFVTREDLEEVLQLLLAIVDPLGLSPMGLGNSHARDLAERYDRLLSKGKTGGEEKRDLVQPKKKDDKKFKE